MVTKARTASSCINDCVITIRNLILTANAIRTNV